MKKLKIHLENCYGIKKLEHEFDFEKSKVQLIYAPNGAMKSSFAKTFDDISKNTGSTDRIFKERINHREVLVDSRDIIDDEVFVIQRMNEKADFREAATILANKEIREEFEEANRKLNDSKKDFFNLHRKVKLEIDSFELSPSAES